MTWAIYVFPDDLRLGSNMSTALYQLVRYEDLVDDPLEVMDQLYNFLGIPVSPAMREQVYLHFHAEEADGGARHGNTFRTSDFNKTLNLPSDVRNKLDLHCKGLMELGNYSSNYSI